MAENITAIALHAEECYDVNDRSGTQNSVGETVKCPHCAIAVHDYFYSDHIKHNMSVITDWGYKYMKCPSCSEAIIKVGKVESDRHGNLTFWSEHLAYPSSVNSVYRSPVSSYVPDHMRDDYREACQVLPISPKASAALSRRILQSILLEQGYSNRDLFKQIQSVLSETNPEKVLPASLRNTIGAVRNFGNFSAHPITEKNSLQVIEVQPNEAEWCLEIVGQLFDHYYVRPAADEKRIAELDKKLEDAGKPPMKS